MLPGCEPNSLNRSTLIHKYLVLFVSEHHTHMIILAISKKPLDGCGTVLALEQNDITCVGWFYKLFVQDMLSFVEIERVLPDDIIPPLLLAFSFGNDTGNLFGPLVATSLPFYWLDIDLFFTVLETEDQTLPLVLEFCCNHVKIKKTLYFISCRNLKFGILELEVIRSSLVLSLLLPFQSSSGNPLFQDSICLSYCKPRNHLKAF